MSTSDHFKTPELVEELKPKLYAIKASSNPIQAKIKDSGTYIEYRTDVKLNTDVIALITPTPTLHLKHLLLSPFIQADGKGIKLSFKLCPEGFNNEEEQYPEDNKLYKKDDVIAYVYILSE